MDFTCLNMVGILRKANANISDSCYKKQIKERRKEIIMTNVANEMLENVIGVIIKTCFEAAAQQDNKTK